MLNVYPQRATNPNNMDTDHTYDIEIHLRNLAAIEELLSTIEQADVWCAWGAVIDDTKRTYLSDLLFGNEDKNIQGIISLFSGSYHFKAYGATTKGYPKHPLLIGKEAKLKNLNEVGLKGLSDRITNKIKNSIMKLKYLLAACTAFFLYLAVMMMNCPNRHSTVILWG